MFRPLGDLTYLRIWHDNSGLGDYASWYLKFVIIQDLQTKQKYYFFLIWFKKNKENKRFNFDEKYFS
mgnify:CR=1 FL=1